MISKVELAHAGDDRLTCFFISVSFECRVFLGEFGEGYTHLFLTRFGLRLDCYADNRLGELHGFQNNGVLFIAKSVAGGGVFKTYRCANVSGVNFRDIFSVVGVHTEGYDRIFPCFLLRS